MTAPRIGTDGSCPSPRVFTREELERELAIVEERERVKADVARRLGNE